MLEDTTLDSELIELELRRASMDFTTTIVDTRDAFVREVLRNRPDVILSDFSLPQFNAIEALRILKENRLAVPFILVTGSQTEEVAVQCIQEGADDYLLKSRLRRLPVAIFGAIEKRRVEAERLAAEKEIQKLANFPKLSPNPILEINPDGHISYYNAAAEQLRKDFGLSAISQLLPANYRVLVRTCLSAGQNLPNQLASVTGHTLAWSFCPVMLREKVHAYGFNMTEQINLESRLRQFQRMESIGQLAAGVAHDFNNVLTVIKGYTGLVLGQSDLPAEISDPLHQIVNATDRAAVLIRQLLSFSRRQELNVATVNVNDVVISTLGLLDSTLKPGVRLISDLSETTPLVRADRSMLEQVVFNLAVNARDSLREPGDIRVTTRIVDVDMGHAVRVSQAREGHFVCVSFEDTGCGMTQAVMHRIFDPFFTTKEEREGAGLGLAAVYGIVRQHHGWIEVSSRPEEGSKFEVYLPLVSPVEAEKLDGRDDEGDTAKASILLVDDEHNLRKLAGQLLVRNGFKVRQAASGVEALKVWEETGGDFDLLLTDVVMPEGISGRELAERLQGFRPDLKVIYTSGYSRAILGEEAMDESGFFFLQKPFTPQVLFQTVAECLNLDVPSQTQA